MARRSALLLVLGTTLTTLLPRGAAAEELVYFPRVPPFTVIHGADANDQLASIVYRNMAIGDLSGDGVPDLVLGARDADGPLDDTSVTGDVHVVFGPSSLHRTCTCAVEHERLA